MKFSYTDLSLNLCEFIAELIGKALGNVTANDNVQPAPLSILIALQKPEVAKFFEYYVDSLTDSPECGNPSPW
ncbi:hypothetical protein JCM17846_31800 [Iodidimonas nitroreducens]|uniref:Uncharacterized protein n=1 Tax=Iodidimonas nitroreducens TaxID=1236968 RepID=A0A5A7NBL6_9PROT|nr:hypothetical protein [Iodidimonas nitroreducens]GER05498.1 hypothetical protein JCM17846_31800 [Iodidimonas nitroreducens]